MYLLRLWLKCIKYYARLFIFIFGKFHSLAISRLHKIPTRDEVQQESPSPTSNPRPLATISYTQEPEDCPEPRETQSQQSTSPRNSVSALPSTESSPPTSQSSPPTIPLLNTNDVNSPAALLIVNLINDTIIRIADPTRLSSHHQSSPISTAPPPRPQPQPLQRPRSSIPALLDQLSNSQPLTPRHQFENPFSAPLSTFPTAPTLQALTDATKEDPSRSLCTVCAIEVEVGDVLKYGNPVNDGCVVTEVYPEGGDEELEGQPVNINGLVRIQWEDGKDWGRRSQVFEGLDRLSVLREVEGEVEGEVDGEHNGEVEMEIDGEADVVEDAVEDWEHRIMAMNRWII